MDLNKYLMSQRDASDEDVQDDVTFPLAKRIECTDGFSLSVQATHGSYCSPRTNIGPWSEVEVGFPSAAPTEIMGYAQTPETPTKTVYGYVPILMVEALIEAHGGMKANKMYLAKCNLTRQPIPGNRRYSGSRIKHLLAVCAAYFWSADMDNIRYWKREGLDGIIYFETRDSKAERAAVEDTTAKEINKEEYDANVPKEAQPDDKTLALGQLSAWVSTNPSVGKMDKIAMLELVACSLKVSLAKQLGAIE